MIIMTTIIIKILTINVSKLYRTVTFYQTPTTFRTKIVHYATRENVDNEVK